MSRTAGIAKLGALCVCIFMAASSASAEVSSPEADAADLFKKITHALDTGAYDEAIDDSELLSDKGYAHPNLSFNRAVSYLLRAASPHKSAGDLGQAAAALEETLLFNANDAEAQSLLERLRYEISRQRASSGLDPVVSRPTLGRSVVSMLGENTWAMIALSGSLLLAVGLALQLWVKRPGVHIVGPTIAVIGGTVLLIGTGLCQAAREHRLHTEPGVVIAENARLLNDQGLPLGATSGLTNDVPEGASVDVLENRGRLAHIAWGGAEGWLLSSDLRLLRRP